MAKYSYEFKKRIVMDYLNGKGGYAYLAKQYGMPDKKDLRTWVNNDSVKFFRKLIVSSLSVK